MKPHLMIPPGITSRVTRVSFVSTWITRRQSCVNLR
jgi:hypothetical protein